MSGTGSGSSGSSSLVGRPSFDQLRSARARREVYPGEWLPEPLVDDDRLRNAETADSLSLAFLHLLEQLSPVERAVFLLHEVFDYRHDEVGRIAGRSPEASRQVLARARRHMDEGRRRFDVSREERDEIAARFVAAWEDGDVEALVDLLAPDAAVEQAGLDVSEHGMWGYPELYIPVPGGYGSESHSAALSPGMRHHATTPAVAEGVS